MPYKSNKSYLTGRTIDGIACYYCDGNVFNRIMQLIGKKPRAVRYYTITDLLSMKTELI